MSCPFFSAFASSECGRGAFRKMKSGCLPVGCHPERPVTVLDVNKSTRNGYGVEHLTHCFNPFSFPYRRLSISCASLDCITQYFSTQLLSDLTGLWEQFGKACKNMVVLSAKSMRFSLSTRTAVIKKVASFFLGIFLFFGIAQVAFAQSPINMDVSILMTSVSQEAVPSADEACRRKCPHTNTCPPCRYDQSGISAALQALKDKVSGK
jgi:hypothetical protein